MRALKAEQRSVESAPTLKEQTNAKKPFLVFAKSQLEISLRRE